MIQNISLGMKMVALAVRESLSRASLKRRPEPSLTMNDIDSVRSFHELGGPNGPMSPVHHFNAVCMNRLVPPGGTVLDLGCGSGQYLRYFAERRPDVRLIGLDLSREMIELGRRTIIDAGLGSRIDLRIADITRLDPASLPAIDAVSCIYTLHHLPDDEDVRRLFCGVRRLRERSGCSVWIFDHCLPRHPATPELFPQLVTPFAPPQFQNDSCNSLRASFAYEDLSSALDTSGIGDFAHACSRLLRVFQVHWLEPRNSRTPSNAPLWHEYSMPPSLKTQFKLLKSIFPPLPLLDAA